MNTKPKVQLGQTVATCNAAAELEDVEIVAALGRHEQGDWGDLGADDWQANERALIENERLVSVYHTKGGQKFYVITERDRSVTTVLLPEDY